MDVILNINGINLHAEIITPYPIKDVQAQVLGFNTLLIHCPDKYTFLNAYE